MRKNCLCVKIIERQGLILIKVTAFFRARALHRTLLLLSVGVQQVRVLCYLFVYSNLIVFCFPSDFPLYTFIQWMHSHSLVPALLSTFFFFFEERYMFSL